MRPTEEAASTYFHCKQYVKCFLPDETRLLVLIHLFQL